MRSSPSSRTRRSRNAIISRNFQVVSMCSSGNGGLRRIERLQRQMQEDRGILADGIEQHRIVGFGDRLADDVDAFGLELREMRELDRRRASAAATRSLISSASADRAIIIAVPGGHMRDRARFRRCGRLCSPHSFFSSCSHHQRPARSGSPGATARVQGAQPIERKAAIVQRHCRGHRARARNRGRVRGPVEEGIELEQTVRRIDRRIGRRRAVRTIARRAGR